MSNQLVKPAKVSVPAIASLPKMVEDTNSMNTYTIPAGRYYLGDPCYVFAHSSDSWEKIGASNDWFTESAIATLNGNTLLGLRTAYGDGRFDAYGLPQGSTIRSFPVDAGLIGLVPEAMIEEGSTYQQSPTCGIIIEFKTEVTASKSGRNGGTLEFGDVTIETDDDDVDDNDHYGDHDDEDEGYFDR